jgi:hypothetical protein
MERRRPALSTSSESTNTDDEGQAPTSNSCGPAVVESESEEHPVVVTAEGEGPYEKAIKYLEKHKIISLFQVNNYGTRSVAVFDPKISSTSTVDISHISVT